MTSHTAEWPHVTQLGDQAARCLDDQHLSDDARALLRGLLYVGAAIEAATDRRAEDADTITAALDARIQDVIEAVDPPYVLTRAPLRWRLAALFRPASAGWREPDGGAR
jgi:hypothetical protein